MSRYGKSLLSSTMTETGTTIALLARVGLSLIFVLISESFPASSALLLQETLRYFPKKGHTLRTASVKFFCIPNQSGLAGCLVRRVGKRHRMEM